jgi:cardiolipin synthase
MKKERSHNKPINKEFSTPLLSWLEECIFLSGDDFFDHLLAHIEQARFHINLLTYIFRHDALGTRVADALVRAVHRGVRTRLLVDGVGSSYWILSRSALLERQGVEVRVFHPLPLMRIQGHAFSSLKFTPFFKSLSRINQRNHCKFCVMDDKKAWIGGMNVSEFQLESALHELAWRDTAAQVTGYAARELALGFERIWARSSSLSQSRKYLRFFSRSKKIHFDSGLVRINDKRRQRRFLYSELIYRIVGASSSIWITNAYFVPAHSLVQALSKAAHAGIDVRIMVSAKSSPFFMPWVTSAFYASLLRAGVRVYEYQASILHAKTMIIDSWATVGSSNLNHRSLFHDLEADVVLTHKSSLETLKSAFVKDIAASREITFADYRKMSLFMKMAGQILLFFKYWL